MNPKHLIAGKNYYLTKFLNYDPTTLRVMPGSAGPILKVWFVRVVVVADLIGIRRSWNNIFSDFCRIADKQYVKAYVFRANTFDDSDTCYIRLSELQVKNMIDDCQDYLKMNNLEALYAI
jgi:hypothetical protein